MAATFGRGGFPQRGVVSVKHVGRCREGQEGHRWTQAWDNLGVPGSIAGRVRHGDGVTQ
jgi:hypothetical protein